MHVLIQSVIDGLLLGGIYAMAAATFSVLYDISKVFHLAFGAIGILGTYVAAAIAGPAGGAGAIVAGFGAGMLAGGLATLLALVAIYRPLVRRGANPGITFVSSLGLSILLQALVSLAFGPGNRTFAVDAFTRQHDVLGFGVSQLHVAVLAATALVIGGLGYVLDHTRPGHQVRALISNPEQAQLVGIRAGILGALATGAVGALSVVPFVFQGMSSSVVLTGGTQLTLFAILAVIAGGVGSLRGATITGFGIGVIGGVSGTVVPGEWSTSVVFVCALALIVARPHGLMSTAQNVSAA